ncbi:MAG: hypothetical protein ACKVOB_08835 [Sphingomonas sp.]
MRAPIGTIASIGAAGVLTLGLVAFVGARWTTTTVGREQRSTAIARVTGNAASDGSAPAQDAAARLSNSASSTSSGSWFRGLFASPKPVGDGFAAAADQSVLDARAPTRVQNFSCGGALSASRVAICSRWSLAINDYNLSLVYRDALARSNDARALRRAHAQWLAKLDTLADDEAAIQQHYDAWRQRLDRDAAKR